MVLYGVTSLSTPTLSYRKWIYDKDGHAALRKACAPPSVDEKLGEEEGSVREKIDAMAVCRKCYAVADQ